MLDFMNQNCGKRPGCVATIPAMKKLLAAARAAKATVIYSIIANTTPADVIKDVAPEADEAHVQSGPDKFVNTDLDKILKDKGIKTVITVGTASNGAVLYTASGAAFRGMNVIIPVDGMSAVDAYADMSTVFTFMNAPQRFGEDDADAQRHDQVLIFLSLPACGERVASIARSAARRVGGVFDLLRIATPPHPISSRRTTSPRRGGMSMPHTFPSARRIFPGVNGMSVSGARRAGAARR